MLVVHLDRSVVSFYFRPVVEDLDEDPPPDENLAGELLRVGAELPGKHDAVPLDDVTQADLRLDRVPVTWNKV